MRASLAAQADGGMDQPSNGAHWPSSQHYPWDLVAGAELIRRSQSWATRTVSSETKAMLACSTPSRPSAGGPGGYDLLLAEMGTLQE